VAVVGGGNSAAEEGLFLLRYATHVTMLVRGDRLQASQVIVEKVLECPQIDVRFHTAVERFEGAESKLRRLHIRDVARDEPQTLDVRGVFIFVGLDPNTSFLEGSSVRLDENGFLVTGHALIHDGDRPPGFEGHDPGMLETSVPGIFAAGDVRIGSTKQVASAAGEGAAVALQIREYLEAH
jgi:thioredoxin reductase (NADPH)